MIQNKIIGYILLMVGLSLIFWIIFQSYQIFTDKVSAPIIFKVQAPQQTSSQNISSDAQKQFDQAIQKQLAQMLPVETLPKVLNLISWSVFAGILIFGGGKITGLGIKMIV